MKIDPNLKVFIEHDDWYAFEKGVGYVPTENASKEAAEAMKQYNRYGFKRGMQVDNVNYKNRNFQKELDKKIEQFVKEENVPTLLLHSCCAPCSSYCLEYLSQYFSITVFYYNPNITEEEEYRLRVEEQKRLIDQMPTKHPVSFLEGAYHPEEFFAVAKGLEDAPEGGARCGKCFQLRLRETAKVAAEKGFDYFTTTLTISPLKNAQVLNAVGEQVAKEYEVAFLPSDFKKKNGYKRSIELSKEYELYRQNYCGCIFSKEASGENAKENV